MTDKVAQVSKAVAAMTMAGAKGRALMGGTTAMRDAGATYLPRFPAESAESYSARRNASWLFNGYRKTVRDMRGRVFAKPVEVVDPPERLAEWLEDVDREGQDLSVFSSAVFDDALSGPGISWIMVDAPPRNGTVSVAQAREANLRPYMVHLRLEDIIAWRFEWRAELNRSMLIHLRIWETVEGEGEEFEEVEIQQIRVLDLEPSGVRNRIFRKNDKTERWVEQPELETRSGLPEITVAPFYACRKRRWKGEPPLDDLADINIAHWQSQSDQRNILHAARVPILHSAGRNADDGDIVIGAQTAVSSIDANAKLEWVEHTGAAIAAGRQDLKDLEFQMETHGLQLLVARPGGQSATGEALDAKKETSQLADMADHLKDTIERCLGWMMAYGGVDGEIPVVDVNKEFGVNTMTAQELSVLLSAVNTGSLSGQTFLEECVRRGMLRPDLDVEAEIEAIEDGREDLMGGGAL